MDLFKTAVLSALQSLKDEDKLRGGCCFSVC